MPLKKPRISPKPSAITLGATSLSLTSLQAILELMKQYDISDFEHVQTQGDLREQLTLRRNLSTTQQSSVVLPSTLSSSPHNIGHKENSTYITSPLVGTFYRAPSPEAPSFVEVGARIHRGQRLCIVEAMKLMNEIEADVDGVITEILVENGKPVEYGHKLFKVTLSQL